MIWYDEEYSISFDAITKALEKPGVKPASYGVIMSMRRIPFTDEFWPSQTDWTCRRNTKRDAQDPIEYLIASEVEYPQAFWAEDACDYALEGLIEGYIPRCTFAKMLLALPRARTIELKGIAV